VNERQSFAARVWAKILAHERAQGLLPRGAGVVAGVSGGPDSVCLAHYLAQRARPLGLRLTLVHVHHGLRGKAADADARSVERLGAALGVETRVRRVDARAAAAARRAGVEEAARHVRYAALLAEARALRCGVVAVGHHLDDQAETVLLNLLRGTRLAGLGAMAPRRPLGEGVTLVRPLLPLTRAEVAQYLARHALRHRLDRSNLSLDKTRNWLRRRLLPLLLGRQPRLREHLSALAAQVRALTPPDNR
jgi:tRNA(Ile)-lysidine synthase